MFVPNEIEEHLNNGEIPISNIHEDILKDINSFDLNLFLDDNDVENSEEFKNVSIEIDEILSGLDKSEVKSVGYYVLLILYTIIIFIGVSGNVTVLMAIFCKKSMRTPHNFFIAALAVSGKIHLETNNFLSIGVLIM